jgi:hypothetical protein
MMQAPLHTAASRLEQLQDGIFPLAGTLGALAVLIALAGLGGSL